MWLVFFPVNERETLLKHKAPGARAGGHPAGGRRAGGRALFDLPLGPQVVAVTTLLTAVDSTGVQVSGAPAEDHLGAIVFLGRLVEGRLEEAAAQVRHWAQGRLSLHHVAVLRLLVHRRQVPLLRQDALLVLDFSLDLLTGVTRLDLEDDGLAHRGLHEDLHLCVCHSLARKPSLFLIL